MSVFTGKTCHPQFQAHEMSEEACCKEEEDHVREHLKKLDTHESMGPNVMDP